MKNLLFGLMATVLFAFIGNAQTSEEEWKKMIENVKTQTEDILTKECPKDLDLKKFKAKLFTGEEKLSAEGYDKILSLSKPLKDYGLEYVKANKLTYEDDNELIFYSSFAPNLLINDADSTTLPDNYGNQTFRSVLGCAMEALGLDLLYASAFEGAVKWGTRAIVKAFTRIATRFLGPVGVVIAVGSFTWCITH
jgi:hypothetical protein